VVPLTETLRTTHSFRPISPCAERGIAVCLVGGAVRDLLLGRPIHDWDFVERMHCHSLALQPIAWAARSSH
jgi:hypothetical protein